MLDLNRRRFLGGAAALALTSAAAAKDKEEYRFLTADAEIEMTIEFYDGYASRGFRFGERMSKRHYCLSAGGEEGPNCLAGFRGSLAIARYRVRLRLHPPVEPVMREHVRTIDRDIRVPDRPSYERSIALKNGVGTDLQAFGYEAAPQDEPSAPRPSPWYLYRQDLFLEPRRAPFLTVHWKHALRSIRVLDLIPGDQTWLQKK